MKILNSFNVIPTKEQAEWSDLELGVIIHFDMPTFVNGYRFRQHWDSVLPASVFNPGDVKTDQWLSVANDLGAKYAILVAKHCTGFSLWPTEAHGYSVKNCPWKNGKGDIVADFMASCKKYGIKNGLYASASCNQYFRVDNPGRVIDGDEKKQKEYNWVVEKQLTELWSGYGDIFEIWFDGGCIPKEKGGPDIKGLLSKYQPNSVVYQGPKGTKSLIRYSGNEHVVSNENASAIVDTAAIDDEGKSPTLGSGNQFGNLWCPSEYVTPNRRHKMCALSWFWGENEEDAIVPEEELFDMYINSVGRNGNFLIGMVIDRDGLIPEADAAVFKKLGDEIKRVFSAPISNGFRAAGEGIYETELKDKEEKAGYISIGEDITKGERITDYTLEVFDKDKNGVFKYKGSVISHKRIIKVPENSYSARLTVNECKCSPILKFFNFYKK